MVVRLAFLEDTANKSLHATASTSAFFTLAMSYLHENLVQVAQAAREFSRSAVCTNPSKAISPRCVNGILMP